MIIPFVAAIVVILVAAAIYFVKKNKSQQFVENSLPADVPVVVNSPTPVVASTTVPAQIPPAALPAQLKWDTPAHIYHAVRVTCDNAGLAISRSIPVYYKGQFIGDFAAKDILCACLYQESRFNNNAINHNRNTAGTVLSTDYGLCQINDFYHIGSGKDFPSVAYVIENPANVFGWMISMYLHGLLKQWVSYSSGEYAQWLLENSPMWDLAKAQGV